MKLTHRIIICVLYLLISAFPCYSIDYASKGVPDYLIDYSWIETKDHKSWKKQLENLEEAENELQRSKDLKGEAGNLYLNPELSDKKKESENVKLEKESAELYKSSLLNIRECYQELLNILQKYEEAVDPAHPAIIDNKRYQTQADLKYTAAGKAKTLQEQDFMSEANENQLLAIKSLIESITIPISEYEISDKTNITPESEVEINEDLYNSYQAYLNDESIDVPLSMQKVLEMKNENVSFETFSSMWNYFYTIDDTGETESETSNAEEADTLQVAYEPTSTGKAAEDESGQEEYIEKYIVPDETEKKDTDGENDNREIQENIELAQNTKNESEQSNKSLETRQDNKKTDITEGVSTPFSTSSSPIDVINASDYLEFRVQIAANKSPLTIRQIQSLYSGGLSVVEIKDGVYYRYQVRGFQLLRIAQAECSRTDVPDAYIVAYTNEAEVNLRQAVRDYRKAQLLNMGQGQKAINNIEFSVQVAASRIRLSDIELLAIYNGQQSVSVIIEDGWYKYQIFAGNNLENAYSILEGVDVNRAFLVAYRNGIKLELYEAINEYKNY